MSMPREARVVIPLKGFNGGGEGSMLKLGYILTGIVLHLPDYDRWEWTLAPAALGWAGANPDRPRHNPSARRAWSRTSLDA